MDIFANDNRIRLIATTVFVAIAGLTALLIWVRGDGPRITHKDAYFIGKAMKEHKLYLSDDYITEAGDAFSMGKYAADIESALDISMNSILAREINGDYSRITDRDTTKLVEMKTSLDRKKEFLWLLSLPAFVILASLFMIIMACSVIRTRSSVFGRSDRHIYIGCIELILILFIMDAICNYLYDFNYNLLATYPIFVLAFFMHMFYVIPKKVMQVNVIIGFIFIMLGLFSLLFFMQVGPRLMLSTSLMGFYYYYDSSDVNAYVLALLLILFIVTVIYRLKIKISFVYIMLSRIFLLANTIAGAVCLYAYWKSNLGAVELSCLVAMLISFGFCTALNAKYGIANAVRIELKQKENKV